jgi:hypothetical protein
MSKDNTINGEISSAIACVDCKAFLITDSSFTSFNSPYGGAVYLISELDDDFQDSDYDTSAMKKVLLICFINFNRFHPQQSLAVRQTRVEAFI